MELKDLFILLGVVSLLVTGYSLVLGGFNDQYSQSANTTQFTEVFDKINETNNLYNDISNTSFASATIDESVGFDAFSKKIWSGIKLILLAPGLIYGIIAGFLDIYGFAWVLPIILAMLSIFVGILIIYFVWRSRA